MLMGLEKILAHDVGVMKSSEKCIFEKFKKIYITYELETVCNRM